MTEIRFYHLTQKTLEQALPELLEKTRQRNWRAVVLAASSDRVESLTQQLWAYRADSFLPHGCSKDGHAEDQPIWLTAEDERPNNADVLFLTDQMSSDKIAEYQLVCEVFDGNDQDAVAMARQKWQNYKANQHSLSYWQQNERGWSNQAHTGAGE